MPPLPPDQPNPLQQLLAELLRRRMVEQARQGLGLSPAASPFAAQAAPAGTGGFPALIPFQAGSTPSLNAFRRPPQTIAAQGGLAQPDMYGGDDYAHAGWGTAPPMTYPAPRPRSRTPVNRNAMPPPGPPPGQPAQPSFPGRHPDQAPHRTVPNPGLTDRGTSRPRPRPRPRLPFNRYGYFAG